MIDAKDVTNAAGFVDVDKASMQHVAYPNIFALGDCASTPNSKTMAAIGNRLEHVAMLALSRQIAPDSFSFLASTASQAGVLHQNIRRFLMGKPLTAAYDGYASCPLVTGYDSCIMAEFDYELQPKETFPFRQDCERLSMFVLKHDMLPEIYWKLMLNGDWNGPEPFRKFFAMFKRARPSNA